ncbi:piggyBac transposable element-derived protein 4-like [Macrobrachium rosenbergii]|uniref:piggyBac transposable element-derived protein 4-like n=1 Tax=Macrobrachium rosenbergii TaxID=79674 RepID=UPI0034D6E408
MEGRRARDLRRFRLDPYPSVEDDRDLIHELLDEYDDEPSGPLFEDDLEEDSEHENELCDSDHEDDEDDNDDDNNDVGSDNTHRNESVPEEAVIFDGDNQSYVENEVNWQWVSSDDYHPHIFDFDSSSSGIQPECPLLDDSEEMDYFLAFFDAPLMEMISEETNRYHSQKMRDVALGRTSMRKKWRDTFVSELYTFFALSLLMPHSYKGDINEYWSTDPLLRTEIFGKTMSRDRYLLLLRTLHFANNDSRDKDDKLSLIRPILSDLTRKFKLFFKPFRNLVIDESLILYKGRLRFKQYIRTKRHRFGIKLFIICCCETGYILGLIVYTGKGTDIQFDRTLGVSGGVVKTMMSDYLNQGHTLFTDNWYTSPALCKYLKENGTGSCGTVRSNRVSMPKFQGKLQKGEQQSFVSNDVLCVKWHDKRDVIMCTTINSNEMVDSGKKDHVTNEAKLKPAAVTDYNINMRMVDKSDMQIGIAQTVRKSVKWYIKLFFHLLDICLLNAYNMYLVKTGNKPRLKSFRLAVIRQMLTKFASDRTNNGKGGRRSVERNPIRVGALHFIEFLPATEKKQSAQRACYVCKHTSKRPAKRKDTRYWCPDCKVPLCLVPCFKEFHTLNNF